MTILKKTVLIFLICLNVHFFAGATNSPMPSAIEVSQQQLMLNGTGIRNKYSIDLFEGGLYLKEKSSNFDQIVQADELMAIKIEVSSNLITAKRLEENIRSEFERLTHGNLSSYQERLDKLVTAMSEDVKKGDVYDLIYDPAEGLKVFRNGQLKTNIIGLDFKQILFSSYLGQDPCDAKLKDGMLGNS